MTRPDFICGALGTMAIQSLSDDLNLIAAEIIRDQGPYDKGAQRAIMEIQDSLAEVSPIWDTKEKFRHTMSSETSEFCSEIRKEVESIEADVIPHFQKVASVSPLRKMTRPWQSERILKQPLPIVCREGTVRLLEIVLNITKLYERGQEKFDLSLDL